MTSWTPLTPTDDEFLASAPIKATVHVEVPVPIERLWELIVADNALTSWSPAVTKAVWSGQPRGVGTTREVTIGGVVTVRERFYRWDVNERATFTVLSANRPGIRRFSEDYVLSETPTGSALAWTVAVDLGRLNIAGPVVVPALKLAFGQMTKGLAKVAARG
ncbi:SRPBCC family protein [Millisia brevis]|uniref:SRPBCC family protein n=1 Tax=Millisia brevis TaxID=264148 RepID=UPI0008379541|nr:SRPBCC family protein [Millisia brevis]